MAGEEREKEKQCRHETKEEGTIVEILSVA